MIRRATLCRWTSCCRYVAVLWHLVQVAEYLISCVLSVRSNVLQLDRYALDIVAGYVERARSAYDAMAFNKVYADTISLVTTRLSATYFDIIKDRLYADVRAGPRRRSAQTALYHVRCRAGNLVHLNRSLRSCKSYSFLLVVCQILTSLGSTVAPLVPLLVEEVWRHGRVPTIIDRWPEVTSVSSDLYCNVGIFVHALVKRKHELVTTMHTDGGLAQPCAGGPCGCPPRVPRARQRGVGAGAFLQVRHI